MNGFQDTYKRQNCCFLGFAQVFSQLYVQKNCQNGIILKQLLYCRLCNCVHGHIDDPPTLLSTFSLRSLYLLSTVYVTHVMNYLRPSTVFPYCKRWKAGRDMGTRLSGEVKWGNTKYMSNNHVVSFSNTTTHGLVNYHPQVYMVVRPKSSGDLVSSYYIYINYIGM